MARRVRQAAPSEESRAASLLRELIVCVDLHYDASPQSGMLLPNSFTSHEPRLMVAPYYNVIRRELSYLGVLIKKLRSDAYNQISCFKCFQEQDWEGPVFDPLSPKDAIDPHKRFLDTVDAMNEHHLHPGWLEFLSEGCESMTWEPGPAALALLASRGWPAGVRLNVVGAK